mgnify:CR=1 FL=1
MRKLNKADIYYILNNPDRYTDAKISKVLGFTEAFIVKTKTKYWEYSYKYRYEGYHPKNDKNDPNKESEPVEEKTKNKQMAVETVRKGLDIGSALGKSKDKNGTTRAVVMTPSASEMSDSVRKENLISSKAAQLRRAIFRPKG